MEAEGANMLGENMIPEGAWSAHQTCGLDPFVAEPRVEETFDIVIFDKATQ